MLTGVPPFDGSSVAAVCAQILSTHPVPPSRRNPALPHGLDHIVMRCLAKKPEDRYPSGEALAASLYPLARRTPLPSSQAKVSWWSRPIQARDVWVFASVLVLAVASVPAGHAVAAHYHLPLAPPAIVSAAPKPPEEPLQSWPRDVALDLQPVHSGSPVSRAPRAHRPAAAAALRRAELARAVVPIPHETYPEVSVTAPALPVFMAPASPAAAQRASLHIHIDASVAEGTLAIFADHDLLLTTRLYTRTQPLHIEHSLPAGPHQPRVALYRPDKSLQPEKEGLGEIRSDAENALTIRVTRRAKHLVQHETALEVVWPSAVAPQPPAHSTASGSYTSAALN